MLNEAKGSAITRGLLLAEGRRLGLAYERQLWRKQIPRKTK
jgi:hypothetical protein